MADFCEKAVEIFDINNLKPNHLGDLVKPRRNAGAIRFKSKLYVFGGDNRCELSEYW